MSEKVEKFFDENSKLTRSQMRDRIKTTCSNLGWREAVRTLLEQGKELKDIKVAEIGCGSGTFSLTFKLLGAEAVLTDADQDALDLAKSVYQIYDTQADDHIKVNVLSDVPDSLKGRFDLVVSAGLAEHFEGEDRVKCFNFHKEMLKEGGFCFIGVPNKLSFPYQFVRWFKERTGKWTIDYENPFTYNELLDVSKKAGYQNSRIVGNHTLIYDMWEYTIGFLAAIKALFPSKDSVVKKRSEQEVEGDSPNDELGIVENAVNQIRKELHQKKRIRLRDKFSAGIILFGFRQ